LPRPVTDDLQRALHTLKGSASMAASCRWQRLLHHCKLVKEFAKANLIPMFLLKLSC
jgi:chemosensory pili system protein ChpA (sensor histidine kinase/response regulator)